MNDSSSSDAKIKDRHKISVYGDNGHYLKGRFRRSHSSCKFRHLWSRDIFQPDDMNNKDTVEAVWSVGKSKTTPSAPGAWRIMKQWIVLSTVRIGNIILVQAYMVPKIGC